MVVMNSKSRWAFDFDQDTHGDQWVSEVQRFKDFLLLDLPNQEQFYEYKHIKQIESGDK